MAQHPKAAKSGTPSTLDPKLLELLVCPVTKGPLTYDRAAAELISESAGLAYPIRDGIPVMLPEEARSLHAAPEAPVEEARPDRRPGSRFSDKSTGKFRDAPRGRREGGQRREGPSKGPRKPSRRP